MSSGTVSSGPLIASDSDDPAPAIKIDNVSKRYGRVLALDALNLTINADESFALLGPNGAGKTTLIHILCTILQPDEGTASVCGFDVRKQPLKARKNLGVVFQEPSLDGRLTVEENLEFHGLVYQVPKSLRRRRIDEMLELVELSDARHRLVRTLSSGMKRRIELARALIHDSRVLILDEPTVGLDAQSRERIWDYLARIRQVRGVTLVVTTHYIDEVDSCDRACVVDHGKVLALDTPAALRNQHGRSVIRLRTRDALTEEAIFARYPMAMRGEDGEIAIAGQGEAAMEDVLTAFGGSIRQVSYERPSLESAFLSLTGHEMRKERVQRRSMNDEPAF